MTIETGKTYNVRSNRKGNFQGRVTRTDETWTTLEITSGRAGALCSYNEREVGEEVTVRNEFCSFAEVE